MRSIAAARRALQRPAPDHGAAPGRAAGRGRAVHRLPESWRSHRSARRWSTTCAEQYDDADDSGSAEGGGLRPDVRAEAVSLEKMAAVFRVSVLPRARR